MINKKNVDKMCKGKFVEFHMPRAACGMKS